MAARALGRVTKVTKVTKARALGRAQPPPGGLIESLAARRFFLFKHRIGMATFCFTMLRSALLCFSLVCFATLCFAMLETSRKHMKTYRKGRLIPGGLQEQAHGQLVHSQLPEQLPETLAGQLGFCPTGKLLTT